MGTLINIRGTNGSGKSTLVRPWTRARHVERLLLVAYTAPTRAEPTRTRYTVGYGDPTGGGVGVAGAYDTPTGGLDGIGTFTLQQQTIKSLLERDDVSCRVVLAEGVLASTVYGSWATFADELAAAGHRVVWAYLDTPVEVCLERIRARQRAAGRERAINEQLVRDKVAAIARTLDRALADGRRVSHLPWEGAAQALAAMIEECGA